MVDFNSIKITNEIENKETVIVVNIPNLTVFPKFVSHNYHENHWDYKYLTSLSEN